MLTSTKTGCYNGLVVFGFPQVFIRNKSTNGPDPITLRFQPFDRGRRKVFEFSGLILVPHERLQGVFNGDLNVGHSA